MPLIPGAEVGPYRVLAPLGAGGMGEVYRAHDPRLGREVALKLLPEAQASDPERRRRLAQEARAASALDHPNVVSVYDVGEHEGVPYIVMQLVGGRPLRERIGQMTVREAVTLGIQVADALARRTRAGIVHRDLKPENIMVTERRHRQGAGLRPGEARPKATGAKRRPRTKTPWSKRDGQCGDGGVHVAGAGAGAPGGRA